jgi:P4 family phage/plasmid primase-like protien
MLRKDGKQPWAPWTGENAPVKCRKAHPDYDTEPESAADCHHSAKFKWGSDGSSEHVHTDFETALNWREKHPEASSDLVFIQGDDPFGFVDGDDVRDPETGEVHPEFIRILDALGVSYADVSTSGSGVHVMYRGELPEGVKQAVFEIGGEAFGANGGGDLPTVEIYDGKHVCVATGDHVVSTGTEVREWDDDGIEDVLDDYDQLPSDGPSGGYNSFDAEDYDADATAADETADDIRDVFAALDRLDAQRVADRTIVREWLEPSGAEHRAFAPTWAPSDYDGTANYVDRDKWVDTGDRAGYGGPAVMAAIDAGLVKDKNCPEAVRGKKWFEALDHLRELGFNVPELADGAAGEAPSWKELVAEHSDEFDSAEAVPDDLFEDQEDSKAEAAATDGGAAAAEGGSESRDDSPPPVSPPGIMEKAFADPYGRLQRDPEGPDPTIHDLRNAEAATYLWDVLEDRDEVDVMGVSDGSFRAFERGVWKHEGSAGEQRLRELGSKGLRSFYSSNVLEQLKEETRTRNQYHVEELGIDEPWIVVGDEALNLKTRETRPVDRDDLALRRIEAEYDPDAEPDLWLDFLSRVAATPETIQKLQEYFGYTLWFHGQPFGKGLFLVGDTDSGKGTALKTLGAILGREENVANEALRDLLESRWGKAQLYGRIVNIRNEVTPGGLQNVEDFKELLGGGDRVTAERKGEQKFRFTVTQKFVFATNQFPSVDNADNAFWNRCLFARFPETIPDEEQRPEFHDDLLAERSGILNWMLDGLDRLFEQGGFTGERSIDEKRNIAEEVGSPLERLKQDALEITGEPTDLVHARDLYDLAVAYAEDEGMDEGVPPFQGGAFTSALRAWPGVDRGESRRFEGNGKDRVFKGIRVDMDVAHQLNVDVKTLDETPSGQTGLDV